MTLQGHNRVIGVRCHRNRRVWNLCFAWRLRCLPGSKMKKKSALVSFPSVFGTDDNPAVTMEPHRRTTPMLHSASLFNTFLVLLSTGLGLMLGQRACVSAELSVLSNMYSIDTYEGTWIKNWILLGPWLCLVKGRYLQDTPYFVCNHVDARERQCRGAIWTWAFLTTWPRFLDKNQYTGQCWSVSPLLGGMWSRTGLGVAQGTWETGGPSWYDGYRPLLSFKVA